MASIRCDVSTVGFWRLLSDLRYFLGSPKITEIDASVNSFELDCCSAVHIIDDSDHDYACIAAFSRAWSPQCLNDHVNIV